MAGKETTLTVFHNNTPIFISYGKWLHPLFELEAYIAEHPIQPENLILQDKIIGKAAALLIHRLRFRTLQAGILSRPDSPGFLRKCRLRQFSCGGGAGHACMDDLVLNPQSLDIVGAILRLILRLRIVY